MNESVVRGIIDAALQVPLAQIAAQAEDLGHLLVQVESLSNQVPKLETEVATIKEHVSKIHERLDAMDVRVGRALIQLEELENHRTMHHEVIEGLRTDLDPAVASVAELRNDILGFMHGYEAAEDLDEDAETDEERSTRIGLLARVADVERLVHGRNRSAPVRRNMVDDDARRVLTGDAKDLGHKEAAELVGLTYAQVYSCRLQYTFKHVHKDLKAEGFKNPWSKK